MPSPEAAHNELRLIMRRFFQAHAVAGDRIVLAVSGGPDSVALAAICAELKNEFSLDFYPVTIDHQLQTDSAKWAAETVKICQNLGFENSTSIAVNVELESGQGIEASARDARYQALNKFANSINARAIILAHTMDDQAETVLMRIARGSSIRSLAGMAHVTGGLWRPLLDMKRESLHAALQDFGIEFINDPHNLDRQFTRVKVRLDVIPKLIEALGQNVISGLARTARMARMDAEALEQIAANVYPNLIIENELLVGELVAQPQAIQTRVVHHWLISRGVPGAGLTSEHVFAVCRMATDPQIKGPIKVAGGVEVHKASGRLRT